MINKAIFLIAGCGLFLLGCSKPVENAAAEKSEAQSAQKQKTEARVELSPEALEAAGIELTTVAKHSATDILRTTGAVESNQQQTQQVTPLVSGRIEKVNVAPGDTVHPGDVLAVMSSAEAAEMHGNYHAAQTHLRLTEQKLTRVQKSENRAGVFSAKARLDEAEASLRRMQRLMELGAGAGKDLVAAQAEYARAKAEYDFESNIAIDREVEEARSEVESAQAEITRLRSGLKTLGIDPSTETGRGDHDTSLIVLRAPLDGRVIERFANPGAGVESAKPLFTISNVDSLWVIANVPESQLGVLRIGTPATVRAAVLGPLALKGRVSYVDALLNEETRTGKVRVEVANPQNRLKAGMFVDVDFETSVVGTTPSQVLVVPEESVQRIGDRSVVFVADETNFGRFTVRDVDAGTQSNGYRRIISGLRVGEKVVSKGVFTLKSQLMKSQFGEE